MNISLRNTLPNDLEVFFMNQTDEEANYLAAFTPKDPHDKEAYMTKWTGLLKNETINMQTVLADKKVIGCVVKFVMEGDAEITYAISKPYWGKGITTQAVAKFLGVENTRPIFGRVAYDNHRSQRVLEKVGFKKVGTDTGFANARGKDIEEFIYRLD